MAHKLVIERGGERVETLDVAGRAEAVLGRSAQADFCVAGESCLSRRHVTLRVRGPRLEVEKLVDATNPVIYKGAGNDRFVMRSGEFFVIGATTFHFESSGPVKAPAAGGDKESSPQFTHTMADDEMRDRGMMGDRMRLLDLMELPVVLRTKSRSEFFVFACGSLRLATGADWVQAVWLGDADPIVLAEDASLDCGGERQLSRRLMTAAVAEAPKPVTYCWGGTEGGSAIEVTAVQGIDWAVCCAMPVPGEEPVLFYVAGHSGSGAASAQETGDLSLRNTARLVGLVADMIGRAISMEKLENWKSRLGQFFSEKVVSEILESESEDALAPRITDATVMFFDIRGFSLKTEENFSLREEENLERILDFTKARRVVLDAVSQCVIDHNGVIISYAGDGLLAAWNIPKAIEKHSELACLAALAMVDRIAEVPGGWRCGIGLGSGQIVAGSLGSDQKEQYDVLGAVVNQSSRIEGLTKVVGVTILVTEATARTVDPSRVMTRRVARFRPAGMQEEVSLYTVERTPADAEARRVLEKRYAIHAAGLEAFEKGDWDGAFKALNPIAAEDSAAKYLMRLALAGAPPKDWRGVIELTAK